jgi:adenylate cyclase
VRTKPQFIGYQGLWRSIAAGLVAAACGLALILTPLGTTFERTFGLDWLFKVRGARTQPPDVAVVGIDSGTGRALHLPRLPHDWPRTVHARLIDRLVVQNAKGIVFDIDFSHPKTGDENTVLARAIAEADRVVLF